MENYLKKLFSLDGRVAVITGGLGILGTEYAQALAAAGAQVCILDLKPPVASHELKNKQKKYSIDFFTADITKPDEVRVAAEIISKKYGYPTILINNAALDFPPKNTEENLENYPLDKWNAVINTNLTGTLICCQVFGGLMAERSAGGSIINISSIYGIVSPDQRIYSNFIKPISYSVTKSGILNLTRYLATYWAEKKIRVNTLTPAGVFNNQDKDFIKKYSNRVPLGRMAKREEYNGAILFLASEASSYMTGSNLIIDGGWTAW